MTNEERGEAKQALLKFLEPNPLRIGTENRAELFIQGYAAGRKSAISSGLDADEAMSVVLTVKAERERATKLIEALNKVVANAKVRASGIDSGRTAEVAIAEYKASRGND